MRRVISEQETIGYVLIFPSVLIIATLAIYPLLYNLYMTFFDVSFNGDNSFTGLNNLKYLLFDPIFWKSLLFTILYTLGTTIGTTFLGILTALAINRPFPGRKLVRAVILLPYAAPLISEVFSWQFLFDPVNGIFIDLTVEKLHLFSSRFNLIAQTPVLAVVVFSIWRNFPFTTLLVLSRLQAIDRSQYDAASVDGASSWQKFKFITLPEIFFIVSALAMIRMIWNFSKFDEVFLLAPHLRTLPVHTYYTAFTGAMEMGLGSAMVIIQVLLLGSFIGFYTKKVLKW